MRLEICKVVYSFCPYRSTADFSGRMSSCIFILNFRAHAHYSISISIDFTLYTLQYIGYWLLAIGYWLLAMGYWLWVRGEVITSV